MHVNQTRIATHLRFTFFRVVFVFNWKKRCSWLSICHPKMLYRTDMSTLRRTHRTSPLELLEFERIPYCSSL